MSINDIMEDEEKGNQVIMTDDGLMSVKDVLEKIRKKAKDNTKRNFSEG
jgi:hypothetical protein